MGAKEALRRVALSWYGFKMWFDTPPVVKCETSFRRWLGRSLPLVKGSSALINSASLDACKALSLVLKAPPWTLL